MKRIVGIILASVFIPLTLWAVTPTRLPNGLSIATETQEASTGPTMAAGDLYVVGNTKMTGTLSTVGAQTATGAITMNAMPIFGMAAIDVAVTSPTVAGQIARTSAYVIYIASGTGGVAAWIKLGSQ
jgi:hypothetical protein